MAAILNISPEEVENLCAEQSGFVLPVNFNSPIQTVIAGEEAPVLSVMEKSSALGAKAVRLNVESAFHTELMKPAAEAFAAEIADISYNKNPQIKFYSDLSGNSTAKFENLHDYLYRHMISPVKFTSILTNMQNDGIECFVEMGPGKVTAGLVKRTLNTKNIFSVNDLKSLEKFKSSCL